MKMSEVFSLPVTPDDVDEALLGVECEAAAHAINHHDALVSALVCMVGAGSYRSRKEARAAAFVLLDKVIKP
jgi:hypothetical protein